MKLSDADIQRLRDVPIQDLLQIKRTGRRQMIHSPFKPEGHDRTPSCCIYPDNTWRCYATETHGHNAVDFLMALGYTFPEAIEELQKY